MRKLLLFLFLVSCSTAAFSQSDSAHASDYPLIQRLPGYYISSYKQEGYSKGQFMDPETERPILKSGKKFTIKYKLQKGQQPASNMLLSQRKGVEETNWSQLKGDESNYYYLITKSMQDSRLGYDFKRGQFPEAKIWVRETFGPDHKQYTLTIVEEDIMTAQIVKKMDTLKTKGRVELYTIYFNTNKYQYEKESELTVNEIVNFLKKEDKWKIQIIGSADSTGSQAYNKTLSEKRAQYIKQALVEKGIETGRLRAEGVGEITEMKDSNKDKALQLNRRTVLIKE